MARPRTLRRRGSRRRRRRRYAACALAAPAAVSLTLPALPLLFCPQPWAMTTVMFVGMSFCLPLAFYLERKDRRRAKAAAGAGDAAEPLLPEGVPAAPKHSELAQALMLFIPTAFDLIATVLMNVGLLSGALGGAGPSPGLEAAQVVPDAVCAPQMLASHPHAATARPRLHPPSTCAHACLTQPPQSLPACTR